jgi:hypothetical protein
MVQKAEMRRPFASQLCCTISNMEKIGQKKDVNVYFGMDAGQHLSSIGKKTMSSK